MHMVVQNCNPGAAHGKWQLGAKKMAMRGMAIFWGGQLQRLAGFQRLSSSALLTTAPRVLGQDLKMTVTDRKSVV